MSNIFKKLAVTFLVVIGFFALASFSPKAEAKAASSKAVLRQAFVPHKDSVTGQTIARVNNWSSSSFDGWICATEKHSGKSTHIGCLKAHMDPVWGANWSFQFGVPTRFGGTVSYTYQAPNGKWIAVAPAV